VINVSEAIKLELKDLNVTIYFFELKSNGSLVFGKMVDIYLDPGPHFPYKLDLDPPDVNADR
jgi:hypothetical protein